MVFVVCVYQQLALGCSFCGCVCVVGCVNMNCFGCGGFPRRMHHDRFFAGFYWLLGFGSVIFLMLLG